jgi:hypothetical protein
MQPVKFLAVCTFELRGAAASRDYDTAYTALRGIGFHRGTPANLGDHVDLPADTVVGEFEVQSTPPAGQVAFLRNCLSYKLREVFQRHGLDAEFLLVLSQGDCAWERGGFQATDFAARHGRGALEAAALG